MRCFHLTLGEMRLQMRYGFYLLYAFATAVYLLLLRVMPSGARATTAVILIYTDPAAMGLFFMGALVLLEKSQRVHCSLAVSPVLIAEYIFSKAVSLAVIGTAVGGVLAAAAGIGRPLEVLSGVFLASILFSLCGMFVAAKIDSLNQFLIATIPAEIVICVPAIWVLFETETPSWLLLHPGIAAVDLIRGGGHGLLAVLSLIFWTVLAALLCADAVKKSFAEFGGGKL